MNASHDIPTMIKLRPCLDFYTQTFPDKKISHELITVLTWFIENNPKYELENSVYCAVRFLSKIQTYIDMAKRESAELLLDIEMLDIFDCVRENFKSRKKEYGFHIAIRMRQFINVWNKLHPEIAINDEMRHLFCYLAHTQPELNADQAIAEVQLLKKTIAFYLDAANKNPYLSRNLSLEKIKYYLWVAKQYPKMEIENVLRWVSDMAHSTLYRRVVQLFPPSYPFSCIALDTHTDGKANLEIWSKTCLASPVLNSLLAITGSYKGYMDKGIIIRFDLTDSDTRKSIADKVAKFFNIIETTLLPKNNTANIFHQRKSDFISEAYAFCDDYINNFPDLTFLQMRPPAPINNKNESSDIGKKMQTAIDNMDYNALQKMLSAGENPNQQQYGLSMLEYAASKVRDYEVNMMHDKPKQKDFDMLLRSNEVNIKFLSHNPYKVIIAKHSGNYNLYWCVLKDKQYIVTNEPITTATDIEFLDSVQYKYFKSDGHIRSCHRVDEINKLREIILPFVLTSLEQLRKEKAATILGFVELLLEYGADAGFRKHDGHPGSTTVIENLIDDSFGLHDTDSVNKNLLADLIRLTMFTDRGRSHLTVDNSNDNHFLGNLILKATKPTDKNTEMPIKIQSVKLGKYFSDCSLQITNSKNKIVYLETVSRIDFSEKQVIVDICKKRFNWQDKMSDQEFTDYIVKKLDPAKEIGVIDLLRDANKNIIAFNIADIILPKSSNEPTLHFIHLAASEEIIQEEFKELMSQVSFQRILYLQELFHQQVLSAYASASAVSYLQTARLSQVYPKYDCLKPADRARLLSTFFPGRKPIEDSGVYYFESKNHYHFNERKSDFADEAILNCRGYNNRIEKKGCSTLVAFYSTPENLKSLARKIQPKMANGLTFFNIAEKAKSLDENVFTLRSKL